MMTPCAAAIVSAWLTLAPWRLSTTAPEDRAELYAGPAEAICIATTDRVTRARLTWQAYAETKLAEPILADRCDLMPKGEDCDGGKAVGFLQVHGHCKPAWDKSLPMLDRRVAAARCTIRIGWAGLARWCGEPGAWFGLMRGAVGSVKLWAKERERSSMALLARMSKE